jgi:RimJ/RimL family protein N-acetyltransferase
LLGSLSNEPKENPLMIRLRKFRETDVHPLLDAVRESCSELIRWMAWCHEDYGMEDARQWVESRERAWNDQVEFAFVMEDLHGRLLGTCGLNRLDLLNRTANLGYWVRTSETKKGVATQAVNQLIEMTFAITQLNRLELLVSTRNLPSQRVAAKVGALREAHLRDRLICQGQFHDAYLYSVLRADRGQSEPKSESAGFK